MLDFLREEGVSKHIIKGIEYFRKAYPSNAAGETCPRYMYYGREVWEQAAEALLCGENLLLAGSKATGKMSLRKIWQRSLDVPPSMYLFISIWTPLL